MGEVLIFLFVHFAGYIIVFFQIIIVCYVLMAIGLMKMNEQLGFEGGWMAWVPFCNSYLLGKLAISKPIGWILAILTIYNSSEKFRFLAQPFNTIAYVSVFVLTIICFHRIYRKFSTKAISMTALTIMSGGLLAPVFIFAIRKNSVMM